MLETGRGAAVWEVEAQGLWSSEQADSALAFSQGGACTFLDLSSKQALCCSGQSGACLIMDRVASLQTELTAVCA